LAFPSKGFNQQLQLKNRHGLLVLLDTFQGMESLQQRKQVGRFTTDRKG